MEIDWVGSQSILPSLDISLSGLAVMVNRGSTTTLPMFVVHCSRFGDSFLTDMLNRCIIYILSYFNGGLYMGRSMIENTRITINIPTKLLQELDSYAERKHITRTAALSVLLSTALEIEHENLVALLT